MQFYGDYHMHSKYSDGRATVAEMVEAAHLKQLAEVGIADHGPNNIGTGVKSSETFLEIKAEAQVLADSYPRMSIKVGAEADVIGLNGELDINDKVIKELDYLLVGLHPYVMPKDWGSAWNYVLGNQIAKINKGQKEKVKNINTKTIIDAIHNYDVLAITHPGLKMDINYQEVAVACIKTDTAIEINTGHLFPGLNEILDVAHTGVDFIVNSDAHFPESVGVFEFGAYVLEKAKIPVERVVNAR